MGYKQFLLLVITIVFWTAQSHAKTIVLDCAITRTEDSRTHEEKETRKNWVEVFVYDAGTQTLRHGPKDCHDVKITNDYIFGGCSNLGDVKIDRNTYHIHIEGFAWNAYDGTCKKQKDE